MILTKEQIKEVIPHREPMLLIDSITELQAGESIRAKFFVRPDWDIFEGHFPGNPVFPGALAVECMAQAKDVLLLLQEKYAGKTPYFVGIDNVRFKSKIKPGDEIEIFSKIVDENAEKAIVTCHGEIYINGVLAVTGDTTVALR